MREAIGGTWIFSIVIVFIVLFSSFLAISVNYSKAFKVKSGIVSILEKDEGFNKTSQAEITNYLSRVGYAVYGSCGSETDDNGNTIKYAGQDSSTTNSTKYKYCIATTTTGDTVTDGDTIVLKKTYYKVKVFFRLDLPIMGNIFVFPVTGETKAIYYANET